MQALEAEVNLREETRVAEQAKPAHAEGEHERVGRELARTQESVRERIEGAARSIRELPAGAAEFAKEIALLDLVARVMAEATGILARPETGRPAIAAETEAIELLLQSRQINPKGGKGGGGGGNAPGGGGTGDTAALALALAGSGADGDAVIEERAPHQATGDAEATFPEEYRAGLDEYFRRLERSIEEKR